MPPSPCTTRTSRHRDRKSTRLNSSHPSISYAVFCLKKKNPDLRAASRDQPGAVRLDEPRAPFSQERIHLRHVEHGAAFSDGDDGPDPGVGRLLPCV